MIKRTVIYGHPQDPEAFNAHYFEVHVPLALKIPHVQRLEVSKVQSAAGAQTPDHYAIAELYYDDEAAMNAASSSEEGRRVAADVANFATGGVVVVQSTVISLPTERATRNS